MCHYHELVPLHSRIFSPINKFYTALIFIYYFLISTGVSYIFFTTKSVTMTRHPLPDLGWNQPPMCLSAGLGLQKFGPHFSPSLFWLPALCSDPPAFPTPGMV